MTNPTLARAFKGPSTQERPFALPLKERDIQRAVFDHWKKRGAPNSFIYHPRNSGPDQADRRRAINARQGVIPGVPDIMGVVAGKPIALELKTEKGRLSPVQKDMLVQLGHCGVTWGVAYGLSEALEWLEANGILEGK